MRRLLVLFGITMALAVALPDSTQAVDLITNNRTITTAVIVEDKGILVLGGLIQEDLREKEERVPLLGSIPLIGALFRSTSMQKVKTNLMFFVKPTILRDDAQAAFETNAKYNYIRDLQLTREKDQVLPTWEAKRMPPPALPEDPESQSLIGPPAIDLRNLTPEDSTGQSTEGSSED